LLWNVLPVPGKGSDTVLLLEVFGDTCRERTGLCNRVEGREESFSLLGKEFFE